MKRPCICIVAGFALGEVLAFAITEKDPGLAAFSCIAAFILCTVTVLESIAAQTNKGRTLILLGFAFLLGSVRLFLDMPTHREYRALNELCNGTVCSYETELTGIDIKGERLTLHCGELIVYYTPDYVTSYYGVYWQDSGASDTNGTSGANDASGTSDTNGASGVSGASCTPDTNGTYGASDTLDPYCSSDESRLESMFSIGNRIRITGEFELMDKPRNPGEFNYRLYYLADGVTHRCFADSVEVTDAGTDRVNQFIFRLRRTLLRRIDTIYNDDDSGVLRAVLLGDKSELSDDLSELYRKNGIAHLLAISGLHVSIIGMTLYDLLRKRLKLSYISCGVICGVWILFYCTLTGSGVSTVRATAMLLISFLAGILGMHYDMLNSAGLAAFLILMVHPYQLFNCAFLLSFSCIIAIAGPAKYIIQEANIKHIVPKSLVLSLCVQLFTLPVTAYFFFEVSLYGFLLNLIVIPLMTYVVWSSLIATILSFISPAIAFIASAGSHYILSFYTWIGSITSDLPFSTILIGRPALWQIFVFYFLFFSVSYSSRLKALIQASRLSMSDRATESLSGQEKTS